jgi:hypothetical protein
VWAAGRSKHGAALSIGSAIIEAPGMRFRTRTALYLSISFLGCAAGLFLTSPPLSAADAAPEVPIRHTPRPDGGEWATAETANFRIFHNQSREVAEKAARTAEAARAAAARKWFGEPAPTWDPPCEVYLYATGEDYSLATGQPPQAAGRSSFGVKDGRITWRRIELHCDDANALLGVLPHETTHAVLAGRFGAHPLPRWADEGMAVLAEPRDRIDLHVKNLPRHRRDDDLFSVSELMQMDAYPAGRRIGAFYAESVSLVDFLSRRKGPEAFARFMRDGLEAGYETALKKEYDIDGFDDLQERWQRYAFGGAAGGG